MLIVFLFMEIPNNAIAEEMQGLSFIGHIQKDSMSKLVNDTDTLKKENDYIYLGMV